MSLSVRSLDQILEEALTCLYAQWYALPRRATLPRVQALRAELATTLAQVKLPAGLQAYEQALIAFAQAVAKLPGTAKAADPALGDLATATPPSLRTASTAASIIAAATPTPERLRALVELLQVQNPPQYVIGQMSYYLESTPQVWEELWAVLGPRLAQLPAGEQATANQVNLALDAALTAATTEREGFVAYQNALVGLEQVPGVIRVAWQVFLRNKYSGPQLEVMEALQFADAGAPTAVDAPVAVEAPTDERVDFFADIRFPVQIKRKVVQWLTVQLRLEAAPESISPTQVPVVFERTDPNVLPLPEFVEVRLMAPDFLETTGVWERTMTVYPTRDSQPVVFLLSSDVLGRKRLTVDFYHRGRMISSAAFACEVTELNAAPTGPVTPEGTLDLAPLERNPPPPADLELRVVLAADRNRLDFMLNSARADVPFHSRPLGSIKLTEKDPQRFFAHWLGRLSDLAAYGDSAAGKERVQQEIEALGEGLFETLLPAELQEAYWSTIQPLQKAGTVQTLLINSDEPWIPWELIKPFRWNEATDADETDNFWVENFVMSRWLAGRGPAAVIEAKQAALVMPELDLVYVQQERAFFDTLRSGHGLQVSGPLQQREAVLDLMRNHSDYQILHFATHGSFNSDNADLSELSLADGILQPADLLGRDLSGIRKAKPLVFLNACHGGQAALGLTGIGGWAEKIFREAKASAFIGALWEVSDDLAAQFSVQFYSALAEGMTLGEALRSARRKVREAQPENPTWLAYALYGDPNAKVML